MTLLYGPPNINQIALAQIIATVAHAGQKRRGGAPYITHCAAVAEKLPDRLKPAGWLHDVFEATKVDRSMLLGLGVTERTCDLVESVTHRTDVVLTSYPAYMDKMLADHDVDVLTLKLADMWHNVSGQPTPSARARYEKYISLFEEAIRHG